MASALRILSDQAMALLSDTVIWKVNAGVLCLFATVMTTQLVSAIWKPTIVILAISVASKFIIALARTYVKEMNDILYAIVLFGMLILSGVGGTMKRAINVDGFSRWIEAKMKYWFEEAVNPHCEALDDFCVLNDYNTDEPSATLNKLNRETSQN